MKYVDIRDGLPEHKQRVHIVLQSPYGTDTEGEVEYFTATFLKGQPAEKNVAFCVIDKDGNKVKPNRWKCGPFCWSDEQVLYWAPIEQPVELKRNPTYIKRCKNKIANKARFEKQFEDYDDGMEDDMVRALASLPANEYCQK